VDRRSLFVCFVVVIAACSGALAYDRSEFLFLDEIEVGMTGVGKTIVAQDVIDEFAVEVLGIIDQPGTLSDFIAVRVSGEAIGRSGGIAQGMSGSPVYIDGKLIGALSRAGNWSKEITPIGLVTPIEPMLEVIDVASTAQLASAPNGPSVLRDVAVVERLLPPDPSLVAALPDAIFAYPVATPLIAAGLSGRSRDLLMDGVTAQEAPDGWIGDFLDIDVGPAFDGLSALNLTLLPMAAAQPATSSLDATGLEPGSSIGVALTTGDLSIGALGTLTYRDGDTLVGFGHPFIANGASQFPMTTVSIIDTMKSFEASFKLGTLGDPIGTIFEDRTAAIGGRIGPMADTIELSLGVHDLDRDVTESYEVGMIDEPHLIPELLLSTGFEAIDTTLDRIGPGTVEVTYQILGDGMPMPLERTDIFLSSVDVAVYPPWQLAGIVAFLQYNAFADPEITRIAASMSITEEIKGIQINHLEIDDWIYAPGDTIRFRIELQTYQGDMRVEEGEIVIPEDLYSDYVIVRAYGGPRYLEAGETPPAFVDLADMIDAVETLPSYDRLTVELFAIDPLSPYADALYGVTEVTYDFPGYVVYNEWEATALLTEASPSEPEAEDKTQTAPNW
jgi:hypothetical protein